MRDEVEETAGSHPLHGVAAILLALTYVVPSLLLALSDGSIRHASGGCSLVHANTQIDTPLVEPSLRLGGTKPSAIDHPIGAKDQMVSSSS